MSEIEEYKEKSEGYYGSWRDFPRKDQLRTDTLNPISKSFTVGEKLFNCAGLICTLGIFAFNIWVMFNL